jgi:hypothetical protein
LQCEEFKEFEEFEEFEEFKALSGESTRVFKQKPV